jgi:hypothetical protein
MKHVIVILILVSIVMFVSCSNSDQTAPAKKKPEPMAPQATKTIDFVAAAYIKLAFQLSKFDADYVDAYFGPEALKTEALAEEKSLAQIKKAADILIEELSKMKLPDADAMLTLRHKNILRMLEALNSRAAFLEGKSMTFDEESKAIYDAVSPSNPPEYYEKVLAKLSQLLPGDQPLVDRVDAFKKQFIIPPDKVEKVFSTAIAEGRKRTKAHIQLLENESFELEYVTDKPWGAYNWFKGQGKSLIQVNIDLPIYIDRAIDLACHEGYPGHHVYYCLIEQELYKKKGWLECSIYPLFSPISLIAEGTANFAVQVAFPGDERIKYEKEVLFPMAGLNPETADQYYKVLELTGKLSFAGNDAARQYIDGKINDEEAVSQLMKFRLMNKDRAVKYLSFIKRYRAYVINYNLGLKMVKAYIEKRVGDADQPDKLWQEFKKLLSAPLLPGDLL